MKALKLWLVFLLVIISIVAQAQTGIRTPYSPPQTRGTVRFFLEDMAAQTRLQFSYSDEVVKRRRTIQLKGTEHTVEEVLTTILAGTNVRIETRGDKILLIPTESNNTAPKQTITVSGVVKDSASREVIIGATVFVPSLGIGITTNAYGFYSLTIPPGSHQIVTGAFGYRADTARINAASDLRRDVLLPFGLALANVTVSSQKEPLADHTHLSMKDLAAHAGLLGENDVLRALQYLPGVQTGADGTTSVLVRGGDAGQNLTLLDGVPLYYIDHFYGLTSVFNTDAVKSVDFYKGAFPARYGGRLSSIVDVTSRDGNMERITGQASLGLVKGSLTLEGPVIKDKASVMLSARRTWIDALWRPFTDGFGLDFYDINAKANYIINKSNRVYASFYTGRDQFKLSFDETGTQARWGNTIGSARWTSIINPKLFISTTATYSYFRYRISDTDPSGLLDTAGNPAQYTGNSTISDLALRVQADYLLSAAHRMQVGGQISNASFAPASADFGNGRGTFEATSFRSTEAIIYAEDSWQPSPKWVVRPGLHLATWFNARYHYASLQPRLYISWKPTTSQNVFGSATRMSQFLHLLSGNTAAVPADFWIPSTGSIEPEHSWLYAVGYSKKWSRMVTVGAELYYKDLRNVVGYKSGNSIFENSARWEDALVQGRGYGYGAEFSANAKSGPLSASAAYTLSWAWRQFDALNGGAAFPYRYDRRHNLRTELAYQKPRFSAIASWTYMSGEAVTLPDQLYPDFDNSLLGNAGGALTYHYTARNDYRLPPIHRLDVALNFIRTRGRHFERTWTLGVFNAYARANILAVVFERQGLGQYTFQGVSLFRFIPTISYAVKF